jgi:hypothetical protein
MIIKDKFLVTAGGKITCPRCQAMSKWSKNQCMKPALRGKSVCGHHGGRSTGPRTAEGKERSRQAHIKSGEYTKVAILESSNTSLKLAQLEEMMHVLKMTTAKRTRGPKPLNYKRLTSLDDVLDAIENSETLA